MAGVFRSGHTAQCRACATRGCAHGPGLNLSIRKKSGVSVLPVVGWSPDSSVLAEESMKFVGKGFDIQGRLKLPLSCVPDVITMMIFTLSEFGRELSEKEFSSRQRWI